MCVSTLIWELKKTKQATTPTSKSKNHSRMSREDGIEGNMCACVSVCVCSNLKYATLFSISHEQYCHCNSEVYEEKFFCDNISETKKECVCMCECK